MIKVVLVMHDRQHEDYYRINKAEFAVMPQKGQYIYNSDGKTYEVEQIVSFAGYEAHNGAVAIIIVHPLSQDDPASGIYGLSEDDLLKKKK